MNSKRMLLALVVALCVIVVALALVNRASATVEGTGLVWHAIGSGGEVSARLSSTVGQTAINNLEGTRRLGSGFWHGVGGGGVKYKVHLPIVFRNY